MQIFRKSGSSQVIQGQELHRGLIKCLSHETFLGQGDEEENDGNYACKRSETRGRNVACKHSASRINLSKYHVTSYT